MSTATPQNPFSLQATPPDNDEQRATLARELRYAEGFALLFAVCNSAEERARQIAALREENPDLKIREFPLRQDTYHLLDVLRTELTAPLPDVVCVYGMENWIRSNVPPKSVPFLLNLNAGRNHLVREFPCPILFWVPEFLFEMIAEAAPDFFSIRSGIYVFAQTSTELNQMLQRMRAMNFYQILALIPLQRQERIEELNDLLKRIRNLPKMQQDWRDEVKTLESLAELHFWDNNYSSAEQLYTEALSIVEKNVGRISHKAATTLHDLAQVYFWRGDFVSAEPLYREALEICEKTVGRIHPDTAMILHSIARLYSQQGDYANAEKLYIETLKINNETVGHNHVDTATTLHSLAQVYYWENKFDEAERLNQESLAINEQLVGRQHPNTAATLNAMAQLYVEQGKLDEAEELASEALEIAIMYFGYEHPNTQLSQATLAMIQFIKHIPKSSTCAVT